MPELSKMNYFENDGFWTFFLQLHSRTSRQNEYYQFFTFSSIIIINNIILIIIIIILL